MYFSYVFIQLNPLSNRGLLKKHIKENHSKYIACEHCGKMFKEVWMLEINFNLHKTVETIKCNICSKLFNERGGCLRKDRCKVITIQQQNLRRAEPTPSLGCLPVSKIFRLLIVVLVHL